MQEIYLQLQEIVDSHNYVLSKNLKYLPLSLYSLYQQLKFPLIQFFDAVFYKTRKTKSINLNLLQWIFWKSPYIQAPAPSQQLENTGVTKLLPWVSWRGFFFFFFLSFGILHFNLINFFELYISLNMVTPLFILILLKFWKRFC